MEPRTERKWLLLLVALALAVRAPLLGQSLWCDELWATSYKLGSLSQILMMLAQETSPPLYHLFMAGWIRAFGEHELSVRFVPLVTGIGSVPLLFALARRQLGPNAALVAAALLTLSPVHVWYSTEARPYAAWLFFVLLGSLGFERLRAGDVRGFRAHAFGAFGTSQMHLYGVLFPLTFLCFAIAHRDLPRRRAVLASNVLWVGLTGAWLVVQHQLAHVATGMAYLGNLGPQEALALFADWLPFGGTILPMPFAHAPLWRTVLFLVLATGTALVFARGMFRLARTSAGGRRMVALLLVLPAFVFVLPWAGIDSSYIERSVLPCLPFFLLVLAAGAERLRFVPTALVGAQIVALAFLFAQPDQWTVYKPKADWRAAAAWLQHDADKRTIPAIETIGWDDVRALDFYGPHIVIDAMQRPNTQALDRMRARVRRLLGEGSRLERWVVSLYDDIDARRHASDEQAWIRIHRLRDLDASSFLAERRRTEPPAFYLITDGTTALPSPMRELLAAPDVLVEAEARFRGLEVRRIVLQTR